MRFSQSQSMMGRILYDSQKAQRDRGNLLAKTNAQSHVCIRSINGSRPRSQADESTSN